MLYVFLDIFFSFEKKKDSFIDVGKDFSLTYTFLKGQGKKNKVVGFFHL